MVRPLALSLLALALSACTVGPDHVRPDMPIPGQFVRATELPAAAADVADRAAPFWGRMGDPMLASLVEEALVANHDLRAALANLDRARALLRGARFDQAPTITAGADASETRASRDQPGGSDTRVVRSYAAQVGAQWEIDLFGRVRRAVEAQQADAWASVGDLDALQVAVVGELARTYVDLRGQQERLRVARANADVQRETLRLVDAFDAAGRGTAFDTARSRAQLASTEARIPALEAAEAIAMHRLAVLTGRMPGELIERLKTPAPIPAVHADVADETPASLLRRRPDVTAAEHRLHAATARIGVSTADLFPRLTLGGLLGTQATSAGDLFGSGSRTGIVALGIDWSFLDVGRVRARIRAAEVGADGALAQYQQTVLLALEETESAFVRHARTQREAGHLERSAADSAEAARLARLRFEAGASGLLDVLDAERSRLQAEDALVDARARAAASGVAVYTALAGGWPDRVATKRTFGHTR
ncbi:MAG: Efflux transport system, outer membrane factor (OMF) lipoprotein [uncultured Lysobacter sp.]|uniref:Efflux transport system, outer membrane factor (OMF) lipoprotein n=1 Tax=uncultured Lysobacter sp. TaxID=271060 RepID=A0A6J4KV82_9GAMM|nr:MAG: Efflux transport system, outer membrane factor (OMF) lipoprotein [uncultured Lysobacter sp.]